MTPDLEQIAKGLTSEQQSALIQAVKVLDFFAGEGMCCPNGIGADDALYDLANAFMPSWAGDEEYPTALRNHLLQKEQ